MLLIKLSFDWSKLYIIALMKSDLLYFRAIWINRRSTCIPALAVVATVLINNSVRVLSRMKSGVVSLNRCKSILQTTTRILRLAYAKELPRAKKHQEKHCI